MINQQLDILQNIYDAKFDDVVWSLTPSITKITEMREAHIEMNRPNAQGHSPD